MRDANQNFSDVYTPALARNAAGTGNINSTAPSIQQGIVERGLAQRAGDISAQLRGGLYSQGLNLAENQASMDTQARLGALSNLVSGGVGASNAGVGAYNGAVNALNSSVQQQAGLYNMANNAAQNLYQAQQAPLTNQYQQWQFGTNGPFAALNNYWNIVGGQMYGNQSQNQSQSQSQMQGNSSGTTTTNPSLLSSIGGGIGILGSLFSDERGKFDARPIGKLDDGQTVYRFRYKHDPLTVHIGLMAQEVEKRKPHAVAEVGGLKFVNYDLATA